VLNEIIAGLVVAGVLGLIAWVGRGGWARVQARIGRLSASERREQLIRLRECRDYLLGHTDAMIAGLVDGDIPRALPALRAWIEATAGIGDRIPRNAIGRFVWYAAPSWLRPVDAVALRAARRAVSEAFDQQDRRVQMGLRPILLDSADVQAAIDLDAMLKRWGHVVA
jgi:hypothetical protein